MGGVAAEHPVGGEVGHAVRAELALELHVAQPDAQAR